MIEIRKIIDNTEEMEKQKIRLFIEHFNTEAKKQKSKWIAKIYFECLHLIRPFFLFSIFNNCQIYYSNNDEFYIIGKEGLENFKKYKNEIIPILEKIPEKFIIEE